jgi:hypothetical protein
VAKSFQPTLTPEEQARETIDGMLTAAAWRIRAERVELSIKKTAWKSARKRG